MKAETLEGLGLTKGEAKVYMALLELGETTTGAVTDRSQVSSSKVYEILNKLMEKGLVSYIVRQKTKYFQAAPPKRLLDYLERKENELAGQKKEMETMLPSLEKMMVANEMTQSARIYEGYEGLRTMFDLILETVPVGGEYYVFFLGRELKDLTLMDFYKNYHRRRIKKGITVKLVGDAASKHLFKPLYGTGFNIRFFPDPVPLGFYIFGDYVGMLSFKGRLTAFVIKSKDITQAYRDFFLSVWKKSKTK